LDEKKRNELKSEAFRIIAKKSAPAVCLAPGRCRNPAIDAHSVPNANTLRRLARDGHVVELSIRHIESDPVLDFYRIGVGEASVFQGLCAEHDARLFDPVDRLDFDLFDARNLFLIGHRAFLRELHAKLRMLKMFGDLDQAIRRLEAIPADATSSAEPLIAQELHRLERTLLYKAHLDLALEAGRWGELAHIPILLEGAKPTVAMSALYSLDEISTPTGVAKVMLNVLPRDDGVGVVFSFLESERALIAPALELFRVATGHYQKYLISKNILMFCENIFFAPDFIDGLSAEQRVRILEGYNLDPSAVDVDEDDPHLYLFDE